MQQEEHGDGRAGREEVADEHRGLFAPAVAERAGKNAQQHVGRIRADREQRRAERGAALPVRPDDEREARHAAAKGGERLRGPQQQKWAKRAQGGKACLVYFHGDFAPYSDFLFWKCKACGRSLAPCGPVRDQTLHGAWTMHNIIFSASCPAFFDSILAAFSLARREMGVKLRKTVQPRC